MADDSIFDDLSDKERKALRIMVKKFRDMGDKEQEAMIQRLSKKDQDAADFLQNIRDMQKRGEKIDKIADRILDRLS